MEFEDLLDSYLNGSINIRRYIPDKFGKYALIEAIPYLCEVLINTDEVLIVRIESAEALGKLGQASAIPALTSTLQDPNEELRRTSVWSLGQIGTPETLNPILDACEDNSKMVRKWALKSLRRVRSPLIDETYSKIFTEKTDQIKDLEIIVELLRSVTDQIKRISRPEIWFSYALGILKDHNKVKLAHSVWQLIATEKGIKFIQKSNENKLLLLHFEKTKTNAPHFIFLLKIISCLRYKKLMISRIEREYSEKNFDGLKIILPFIDDWNILSKYLQNEGELVLRPVLNAIIKHPSMIRIEHLEVLISELPRENDLMFILSVAQNESFDSISKIIENGKILSGMLMSLTKFGIQALNQFEKFAIKGTKNQRRESLSALIQLKNEFPNNPKILEIIQDISLNDRIWHIRRDARIALE